MKTNIALALILGLLLGSIVTYLVTKPGTPDSEYWVAKAAYDQAVKEANAKTDAALAVIGQKEQLIATQTQQIAEITAAAGKPSPAEKAKDKEIAKLQTQVAAYESQGDLAAALAASKAESKAWALKLDLAERRHQDSIISLNREWQVKFDVQAWISDLWKAAYERERSLRLAAESLIHKQTKTKLSKYARYGGYALAFVAGNLSHR